MTKARAVGDKFAGAGIGKVLEMRSKAVLDECNAVGARGLRCSAAGLMECKLLLSLLEKNGIIPHSTLTIPHSYPRGFDCMGSNAIVMNPVL